MVDRNDIDALLIGSLYGELSSAEEARLKAHLESHPADRTALDGLVLARGAVRASRIFELQAEPPQSISALLLQEAARRAPRTAGASEGWFARLRRSFLMHPAMAAAAMLVVVASVASTVYVRKGDHFAEPQLAETASTGAAEQVAGSGAAAPAPAATPTAAPSADDRDKAMEGQMQAAAGDAAAVATTAKVARAASDTDGSFRVGLADGKEQAELQKKAARAPAPEPEKRAEKPTAVRAAGPRSLLEVSTPRPAPKELDDEPRAKNAKGRAQRDFARPADEAPVAAPMAEPAADAKRGEAAPTRAPMAAPPPPAATAGQGMAQAPAVPTGGGGPGAIGGAAGAGGTGGEELNVDASLAWARDQHSRLIGQVRAGQCTDAAGTAVALSNRAPGYYQQNVENDRSVKNCLPYINAERERAEKARARAVTVRRGSYEAPAAAPAQKQAAKKTVPAKTAPAKPAAADRAADPGAATTTKTQ